MLIYIDMVLMVKDQKDILNLVEMKKILKTKYYSKHPRSTFMAISSLKARQNATN